MSTENEERLAEEIMKTVRRLNLPLKLDRLTEAKGNCFPLAVLDQCKRPEIFPTLNSSIQEIVKENNQLLLRKAVKNFMLNSSNSRIQEVKRNYKDSVGVVSNRSWIQYWELMIRNYEWIDQIFVQETA